MNSSGQAGPWCSTSSEALRQRPGCRPSSGDAMKTCSMCHIRKSTTEYHRNRARDDGVAVYCKSCTRIWARRYVREHRKWQCDRVTRYKKKHPLLALEMGRRWSRAHPHKNNAKSKVGYAIKTGRLVRMPCMVCGHKAHAHHEDYNKPLDVLWLCPVHHRERHEQLRADGKSIVNVTPMGEAEIQPKLFADDDDRPEPQGEIAQ